MRVLFWFTLALVVFLGGALRPAHADVADFKMHVLDPSNPPGGPDYIEGLRFSITFAPCADGELPRNTHADGCFLGFNRSNQDWTALRFTFANNDALHMQPADCSPLGYDDLFATTNCRFQQQYILDFSDGIIHNGEHFFITEDGVDPALFGTGDALVTSYTASTATPEPSTVLLLVSGVLLFGFFGLHRTA